MSEPTKLKKVRYETAIDDNNDYLVPLQYDERIVPLTSSSNSPSVWTSALTSINLPISLFFLVGIGLCQLIMGLVYFGQCSVQPLIIVWMIVSGCSSIIIFLLSVFLHFRLKQTQHSFSIDILLILFNFIALVLFFIGWFFAGQVFVFEVKLRVEFFDRSLPEYCNSTLYKGAYISIFIEYLIILFVIILNLLSCITPANDVRNVDSNKKVPLRTKP